MTAVQRTRSHYRKLPYPVAPKAGHSVNYNIQTQDLDSSCYVQLGVLDANQQIVAEHVANKAHAAAPAAVAAVAG